MHTSPAIAIFAHEFAIAAIDAAWEAPSKRAWADAVSQAETAREETETHAADNGAAIAASREAEAEARRAAEAHAARWAAGRRASARWARQAAEDAIRALGAV